MKPASLALTLAFAFLWSCPGDAPGNPPQLWLALVGNDETRVQLVPREPNPF
ncbi:MAG TPA: hypothetical protein VKE22_18565 [Haliangiales bacterium]|nr:hypothetical protein [Haliangiales bacterium]